MGGVASVMSDPVTSFGSMALSMNMITIDSADPEPLARWWAERFGAEVVANHDGWFLQVAGGSLAVVLGFQKVADPTPGKNRMHLDLASPDPGTEVAGLVAAGAREVARNAEGGFAWTVLADPQGNQFCVSAAH